MGWRVQDTAAIAQQRATYTKWGEALFDCRKKQRITVAELANRVGESKKTVADWEDGIAFPRRGRVLARLYGSLSDLRKYDDLIPQDVKAFIANDAKEEAKATANTQRSIPPPEDFRDKLAAASEAMAAEEAMAASTPTRTENWFEALANLRAQEGLSRTELADLLGNLTSSAVEKWERGISIPILHHWHKLLEVFPELGQYSLPNRDSVKPGREIGYVTKSSDEPTVILAPVPTPAPEPVSIAQVAIAYADALTESTRLSREIGPAEERVLEAQIALEEAKKRAEEARAKAASLHDELLKAAGSRP